MSRIPEELDDWISAYFEGELDPASQAWFEESLRNSEEVRRIFCQSAATQSDMERVLGRKDPDIPVPSLNRSKKSWVLAAAAVLILSLILPFFLQEEPKPFEWVDNGRSPVAVEVPDSPGTYRANREAEIELEPGVLLAFSEGTRFSWQARTGQERLPLELFQGTLQLTIEDTHPGVWLQTPVGGLKDIGTSFLVEVKESSRRVFAEVTDGKVAFLPKADEAALQTLTPDQGRLELSASNAIGHVLDREGNGTLRPFMGARWSVAQIGMPLEAKDWVRTGRRGAHALTLRLRNGTDLILGPDTLVELESAQSLVVHHGEFQVKTPEGVKVTVKGPEGIQWNVSRDTVIGRVVDREMTRLDTAPGWLSGYLNDESTEAMGSLMAKVDGRNLPLTMGYHKVTVDIRDQIARTVIEESFLNHTGTVLEGVFYFPLPADASISEFGMWIGDELVHGEIVEKQRAREIYETILREKRDPALLEWSGGNIFKARVYPIVGEKRIKIGYTQILPKTGDRYTYRYGLQSDQFRQYPLQELALTVRVHSQAALKDVFSPTHLCRTDRTEHAAVTEYRLQDAVPERDFVLHIDTVPEPEVLQVIPHRRADDGYFMLLLQPPSIGDAMTRALLPDSEPMQVVVMVDTSGSVSGPARIAQLAFLEAFLNGLGDEDRFQVMTFDSEVNWATDSFLENTPANRRKVLTAVEQRSPLGWTDLDLAFDSLSERIRGPAQVLFLGDGVLTTGDVDAQAWMTRFRKHSFKDLTFHAVAPANQYDAAVLKAIAATGSGSWRRMETDDPSVTAQTLLNEMTTPSVKDLKVTFRGLEVAAVYPETLPHLPAGSQQRIVGRYDVASGPASGTVEVTGTFQGKAVSYTAELQLDTAEEGNSFIPRLWARRHLDMLLEQGRSESIREQIIGLSEGYQIITPYTSFLVLESDADRERFQVQKKFRMRDGEDFFAEGRAAANQDLRRQQMIRARTWRKNLYQQMRNELLHPGRQPLLHPLGQPHWVYPYHLGRGVPGSSYGVDRLLLNTTDLDWNGFRSVSESTLSYESGGMPLMAFDGNEFAKDVFRYAQPEAFLSEEEESSFRLDTGGPVPPLQGRWNDWDGDGYGKLLESRRGEAFSGKQVGQSSRLGGWAIGGAISGHWWYAEREREGLVRGGQAASSISIHHGFPHLTHTSSPEVPDAWSPEIQNLLSPLNRRAVLADADTGYMLRHSAEYRNHKGQWIPLGTVTQHVQGKDWWSEHLAAPGSAAQVQWVLAEEQGMLDTTWGLGRIQIFSGTPSVFTPAFHGYFGTYLQGMSSMQASILPERREERVEIRFVHPQNPDTGRIWRIDPSRKVLLDMTFFQGETVTQRMVFSDLKQIGDHWWPQRIDTFDEKGELVRRERVELTLQDAAEVEAELKHLRDAVDGTSVLLAAELPSLIQASQAHEEGRAGLEDLWVLLADQLQAYRPELAERYWQELAVLLDGKPCRDRLELVVLQFLRRLESYHHLLLKMAGDLKEQPEHPLAYSRAASLLTLSQQVTLAPRERKDVLEVLEPVFRNAPDSAKAMPSWYQAMQVIYDQMGQREKAFALIRLLAEQYPDDVYHQMRYAQRLAGRREIKAALNVLERALEKEDVFAIYERQQLQYNRVLFLWQQRRLPELIRIVERMPEPEVTTAIWSMYLTALIADQQVDRAQDWMRRKIQDVVDGSRSPEARAAYQAAIQRLQGNGYDQYTHRMTQENSALLKQVVLDLLPAQDARELIEPLLSHYQFRNSAEAPALWQAMYRLLTEELETLPARHVADLIRWVRQNYVPDEEEAWQTLHDRIFTRWRKAADPEAAVLESILMQYGSLDLRLNLVRVRIQRAETPEQLRVQKGRLFDLLLQSAWSEEVLEETAGLLEDLDIPDPGSAQHRVYQWVQWVTTRRYSHLLSQVEKMGAKSRREQGRIETKLRKENRQWMITWLQEMEQHPPQDLLLQWLQVERAVLQTQEPGPWTDLQAEGLEVVGNALEALPETVTRAEEQWIRRWVDVVSSLAMKSGQAEFADSLIALFRKGDRLEAYGRNWKHDIFRLLVVTDQGDRLEQLLQTWHSSDDYEIRVTWAKPYAWILAERNQLSRACEVFEFLRNHQFLDPADYRTLSDWYLVLDQREKAEAAKKQFWHELPGHRIHQWLNQHLYRHSYPNTTEVPEDFDPEIAEALNALQRKSMYPEQNLYLIQQFYQRYRDFRLLAAAAESVMGQSPQGIYQQLGAMQSVLNLLQEEATLDRVREHILDLQKQGLTETDQRAMHLLTFMVSFRAATQAQGEGPHVERCYQALVRAFHGEWAEGEAVRMSALLAGWGALSPEKLRREQLRQMKALRASARPGSEDHLTLSRYLAGVYWSAGEREEAVRLLERSLDLRREQNGGRLLANEVQTLRMLSGYLTSLQRFRQAEDLWREERKLAYPEQIRQQMKTDLYRVYEAAFDRGGMVSIGSGKTLYQELQTLYLAELREPEMDVTLYSHWIQALCTLWREAHEQNIKAALKDSRRFAFSELPGLLQRTGYMDGQNVITRIADCLDDLHGPLLYIEFMVVRAENEPLWMREMQYNFWYHNGAKIAQHRAMAAAEMSETLKSRLWMVVREVLQEEMRSFQSRNQQIYWKHSSYFWSEKQEAFRQAALEVLREFSDSEAHVLHITHYLRNGLRLEKEATEHLEQAYRRGILSWEGRFTLSGYFQAESRYEEALAVLRPLVEEKPGRLDVRIRIMKCLYHQDNLEGALEIMKEAEQYFRTPARWGEHTAHEFAQAAAYMGVREQAVAFYEETIEMHVKSYSNRGVGNGTLSTYYEELARHYQNMKQTGKAVDAIAGAIVSWGPDHDARSRLLDRLERILNQAEDLEAFVAGFEEEVAESGMENAILRKALGKHYLHRGEYEQSIHHLRQALEVQPDDDETRVYLLEAYSKDKQPHRAIELLIDTITRNPADLQKYHQLAERYETLDQPEQAERAYTSMVEARPEESESHEALALVREKQTRWADALVHWENVIRIRTQEPTGYVGKLRALLQLNRFLEASTLREEILQTDWPDHFGDVNSLLP